MAVSPQDFKAALSSWPSGVTVVTTLDGSAPRAITVSAFASVSLTPPLILVSINADSPALDCIQASNVFAVNMLAIDQADVSKACSTPDRVGMNGVRHTLGSNGCALIDGAVAQLECQLHVAVEAGDHVLVLGLVTSAYVAGTAPLLYWARQYGEFEPLKKPGGA